jgi:large subunit ribosomal protein L21
MFAVVKTGGKQYRVAENDVLLVEKLDGEEGSAIQFAEVLMLGGDDVTVGTPFVKGASVSAEVLEQLRGPKVISFKKRRRKHSSQRTRGHRQHRTRVRITGIAGAGQMAATAEVAETAEMAAYCRR